MQLGAHDDIGMGGGGARPTGPEDPLILCLAGLALTQCPHGPSKALSLPHLPSPIFRRQNAALLLKLLLTRRDHLDVLAFDGCRAYAHIHVALTPSAMRLRVTAMRRAGLLPSAALRGYGPRLRAFVVGLVEPAQRHREPQNRIGLAQLILPAGLGAHNSATEKPTDDNSIPPQGSVCSYPVKRPQPLSQASGALQAPSS